MTVAIIAAFSFAASLIYSFITGFTVLKFILALLIGFLGANVLFIVLLAVICLIGHRAPPIPGQSPICHFAASILSEMACTFCGVRIHASGTELISRDEPFLMVCNHRSGFDILVMLNVLRQYPMGFISKISNMEVPVVGEIAEGIGCLAIDRENNRKALETVNMAASYVKNGVCSMIIFPEGTRNKGEGMLPFHRGSFKIAKKAGSAVVVASMRNTRDVLHNALRGGTDVYFDILQVISADECASLTTAELASISAQAISNKLRES